MKYGEENSRIDIMLQADDRQNCYIEVKSVTLAEKEYGYFPDAVTTRGQKHLRGTDGRRGKWRPRGDFICRPAFGN